MSYPYSKPFHRRENTRLPSLVASFRMAVLRLSITVTWNQDAWAG
ncbi:predicted protein [Plenodomus lingam JN3]|uniref:Predicted protein n=1 Tax=Leptosphaeria maculans (strain JN3 / isolate v23.1.3 / race Av1-4-5-6-7-8) TaxID=985895 RepID=E4ZWT5_LEPMJ|nr:predicted protein [Plenodomus lingam JN3]CBX96061.1 predicted protein [Plenodomus lingam JN3]